MDNHKKIGLKIFKCAFPNGLTQTEWIVLLFVMRNDFSFRRAAELVGELIGSDYKDLLTYTYLVASPSYEPDPDTVSRILLQLEQCGYNEWIQQE